MAYTTIDDGSVYFQTALYTGTAGVNNIVNDGNSDLQPDWVWLKSSSLTQPHTLRDSSRGTNKFLYANLANAEGTNTYLTSFNSDGFSMNSTDNEVNGNGDTYVAWQWKCNGGTTETAVNESGSNPANVRQTNTTAGFSIITYTGTGSAGTIAHGLGVVPEWIIVKGRDIATDGMVYHGANTSAPETDALTLPENSATSDNAGWWNDTAPTSSVFTLGTHDRVNKDGNTYIAYCFTPIKGYSKFGSYTGNGDADGPFVYTGFKPAWVLIKETGATRNWTMADSKSQTAGNGGVTNSHQANTTGAKDANERMDWLSDGFRIRTSSTTWNTSSGNFVYMCFAEHPFVSSKGVPTTAR